MKNIFILIFVLIFQLADGQNQKPIELGIGFVVAANSSIYEEGNHYDKIYSDPGLKTKFQRDSSNKIFPFFYKPDYDLYHFICLAKTTNNYKILVNDSTIAFIPNDSSFYFTTWEKMLINSVVERITKDNPIRSSPSAGSQTINQDCKFDRLKVVNIIEQNDEYWLYISFSPTCDDYPLENSKQIYGWIKWRTKNKLLVDILLLC